MYITDKINYYSNGNRFIALKLENNKIVFDKIFYDSEGSHLNPLNYKNKETQNTPYQFKGELFKNKPAILFGFTESTFGNNYIYFMSKSGPSRRVLCDNKH